jgi:hypothetical protein
LVLTLDFAFANSNASTHTNYLIELLKNEPDASVRQTHNYTGGRVAITSPWAPVSIFLGVNRGTPFPQRAAHYTVHSDAVNTFSAFFSDSLETMSDAAFREVCQR